MKQKAHFSPSMLPMFSSIDPTTIVSAIHDFLETNRRQLTALLSQSSVYTWENLMQPLEEMNDELSKRWSPISHLHAVKETPALRAAYNEALTLLTDYHTEIAQHEPLFNAISSLAHQDITTLNDAQRKIIENDLRDFKLAGIHLPADKKAIMAARQKELSQLMTRFAENVLDATQHWYWHTQDINALAGLPAQAIQLAKDNAKERSLEGYVITLDYPSYSTAIRFLEDRRLRKTLYEAYVTRASDCGPDASKWDNTPIMADILKARHDIAQLAGFDNYAAYSLATKMAKTSSEVLDFLYDLLNRSKAFAEQEYQDAFAFAVKEDQLERLEAWDMPYYAEKYQTAAFHFNQEDCRPYFPIERVLQGLFAITHQLFGIHVQEENHVDVWHPHVRFFSITDDTHQLRGGFYIDLYARAHKRDGAWMDDCRARRLQKDGEIQYPVAYLTCNFMPPVNDQPALLTHDDVLTLFHEFGHCLHHLLTKVDYPSVGGINGVPWDAVEFPSQMMENFCWEKKSLSLIASHYQTGEPLPDELFQKMWRAKHFQTGLQMLRQIEFALFDFRLHLEYDPAQGAQINSLLNDIRKQTAITPVPAYNRFAHSFSHIFAGSYAAGYYSYKWAEVLSADAYAKFEEKGIFDRATGRSFMENILEAGGVRDPMTAFSAFRGRKPQIEALLRHSGIQNEMTKSMTVKENH